MQTFHLLDGSWQLGPTFGGSMSSMGSMCGARALVHMLQGSACKTCLAQSARTMALSVDNFRAYTH